MYTILKILLVGLTKYSRVNWISKIDLAPAHTTVTGVLPSSVRSALISNAVKKEQSRCVISWFFWHLADKQLFYKKHNTMGTIEVNIWLLENTFNYNYCGFYTKTVLLQSAFTWWYTLQN